MICQNIFVKEKTNCLMENKKSSSVTKTIIWGLAIYGGLMIIDKRVTKIPLITKFNQTISSVFSNQTGENSSETTNFEGKSDVTINSDIEYSNESIEIYNSSDYIKVISPSSEQKNQILTFLTTRNKSYPESGESCNCEVYCYYCSKPIRGLKQSIYQYVLNEYINNYIRTISTKSLLNSDFGKNEPNPFSDFYQLINSDNDYQCIPQSEYSRGHSNYQFCSKKCVNDFELSQ